MTRDSKGQIVSDVLIDGIRSFHINSSGLATEIMGVDGKDPALLTVEASLWLHRALLETGHGRVLGQETVSGREALKVELPTPGYPDVVTTALLDVETRLPLEVVYKRLTENSLDVISSHVTEYQLIETLPQDALNPDVFAPVPGDRIYQTRRKMTLAQARTFSDFGVFYCGPQVNGFQLFWVEHVQTHQVLPQQKAPTNMVSIIYTPQGESPVTGSNPQVYVNSEKATPSILREREEVQRAIQDGVVQGSLESGFKMELLIGNTLITLGGRTEEEVLKMKEALVRLN